MASFEYGGYVVKPDGSGWMIAKPYTVRKGKHAGETSFVPVAFCGTLSATLTHLKDRVLRDAPGHGISVLQSSMESFDAWVRETFTVKVPE